MIYAVTKDDQLIADKTAHSPIEAIVDYIPTDKPFQSIGRDSTYVRVIVDGMVYEAKRRDLE